MNEHEDKVQKIKAWLKTGSINIFGPQFSGKDTQARRLAGLLDGQMLSGGDILRKSNRQDVIQQINTGDLAPTEAYLNIVMPHLNQKAFADKPLILSSVGRWHGEETGVLEAAEAAHHPVKAVVYLKLYEKEVWKRREAAQKLKDRGYREDESHEALKRRLEEFRDKTLPVIDFYRNKDLLLEIDGSIPPEQVTSTIIARLADRAV